MSRDEAQLRATCSRRVVNFLTALMPTLEGLFLVTVLDGKAGEVLFRYDPAAAPEVSAFMADLIGCNPGECTLVTDE